MGLSLGSMKHSIGMGWIGVLTLLAEISHAWPVKCVEQCQYFDSFQNQCHFQSKCEYIGYCMRHTFCERWDNFANECVSVATQTQCHSPDPYLGSPACTENCQYFDTFENKCLYRTRCDFFKTCAAFTRCEVWDGFDRRCAAESKSVLCN